MLCILLVAFLAISPALVLAQVKNIGQTQGLMIVCNAPSESALDEDNRDFNLTIADLKLCTHLICQDKSYKNAQLPWEWTNISYLKQMQKDYKQFTNSRRRFPHLKISLGVDPTNYFMSINSPIDHIKFAENAFRFVSANHFDGMNLLWRKSLSGRKQVEILSLLRQLKKIFKPNKLLLTTSYDGKIDNILYNNNTLRDAAESVDFMHVSVYDYDSLDHQYNNCQSHASNISNHLSEVNVGEMLNKSLSIKLHGVKLQKIVFEQRFIGFDMNIPLRQCTPLNYNQICGILTEGQDDWNVSSPRYYDDWIEAINQNNSHAIVLESKNWLVYQIKVTVLMCAFGVQPYFGGFIINLNTDDYSGKCNFKEYPYLKNPFYDENQNYTLQVPRNPTFPLLKTIRSTIEMYFKAKQDQYKSFGIK